MVHAVVRQPAVLRMKILVPLFQRADEGAEAVDVHVRGGRKLLHPFIKTNRRVHRERLVRAKRGQHLRRMPQLRKRAVMFQIVHRVIRRADDFHLHLFQQALRRERRRGELGVRRLPDFRRRLFAQQIADAEIALQFQMRPVIQRIPQRVRHCFRPRVEFLLRRGVAGAEFFRDAVAAHRAPFVMVAFEPDLEQVFELPVFRDVLRRNMAVIIKDRFRLGEFVIQPARGLVAQQKIVVDEWHNDNLKNQTVRQWSQARLRNHLFYFLK